MVRTRESSSVIECPICMDPARYAAETNCGHLFCGECILQVWQSNDILSPICCPYCRQEVSILLQCFTGNEENETEFILVEQRDKIKEKIKEYNRRFSQLPSSFMDKLRDLPTILRHVWAEFFTYRGLEFFYRLRIVLCLIVALFYVIIPFDFFPENVLGLFGFIDDFIIITFLLIKVSTFYRVYVGDN